jgi:hypothetical protein
MIIFTQKYTFIILLAEIFTLITSAKFIEDSLQVWSRKRISDHAERSSFFLSNENLFRMLHILFMAHPRAHANVVEA